MTDRDPTPEERQKFKQWRAAGSGPNATADDSGGGWSRLPGATLATAEGVGKGIANVSGNLPTLLGLPPLKSKWASSGNPDYPVADMAGRFAPDLAALAMLPSAGIESATTEALPFLEQMPKTAKAIGNIGEAAWKSYIGGGTQGQPEAGAATGTAARTALEIGKALPGKQYLLPAAVLAAGEMAGRGYIPWGIRHPLSLMAELVALMGGKVPGAAGAIGGAAYDSETKPDANQ